MDVGVVGVAVVFSSLLAIADQLVSPFARFQLARGIFSYPIENALDHSMLLAKS